MQIQEIIDLYQNGLSQYAIAKKFNIPHVRVRRTLLKHNIPIRQKNKNKKYSCNDSYFSLIDSAEKAYWLGFLTADGSVSKDDNEISIGLSYRDINHIEKFKSAIQSNSKIYIYDSIVKGTIHKCCKFCFYSPQMKIDLSLHNVVPNKSKTLEISTQIPKQFINSYLLGIIDGDGSFYIDKSNQAHLNLIGSKNEVESIQKIFMTTCNVNQTKIQQEKRSKEMWYLNYGGNGVINKIVNYLYNNNETYLERKYEVIKHLQGSYIKRKPGRQVDLDQK